MKEGHALIPANKKTPIGVLLRRATFQVSKANGFVNISRVKASTFMHVMKAEALFNCQYGKTSSEAPLISHSIGSSNRKARGY
ncbi:hypothetical protein MALU111345_01970 [Marinicrinis lubricantis]